MTSPQGGSVENSGFDVLISCSLPLQATSVRVILDRQRWDMQHIRDEELRTRVQHVWKSRVELNPTLFNASKFRLGTVTQTQFGVVEFGLGLCDYATFLGTNRASDVQLVEDLYAHGQSQYNDVKANFANALGNAALIITSDGFIPLFQRSYKTGEFAGWWDVPGGHPEPSRCGLTWNDEDVHHNDDVDINTTIVHELFDAVTDEILAELNLENADVGAPQLIGVISAHASRGKPTAVFIAPVTLTASEVATKYQRGGKEAVESNILIFISRQHVQDGYGKLHQVSVGIHHNQNDHVPTLYENIKDMLVPSCAFALEWWNLHM